MHFRSSTLPLALGFALASAVLVSFLLQVMSGTPLWFEYGPLSFAQAILIGLLGLPCLAISLQTAKRPLARLFWASCCFSLLVLSLVLLVSLTVQVLPEPKSFDYPATLAWAAAALALVLIERLDRPLGGSRGFLCFGFALHCVAFLADFADGGIILQLSSISLGLLGTADEVLELLCLAAYFIGLTLLALNAVAASLWRPFDTEPRPLKQIFAAAFNPSRAYAEAWLARDVSAQSHRGSTAAFLHAAHRMTRWRDRNAWGSLLLGAHIVLWPLIVMTMAASYTARNGAAIRARCGKPIPQQLLEQALLAFSLSLTPRAYYMFELFLDERRDRAVGYLQRFETKRGIYRFLKQHRYAAAPMSPLNNKADFIDWCLTRDLPTVPYYLLVGSRGVERSRVEQGRLLPSADLFVKPNKGRGGKGAERWRYREDGTYRNSAGQVLDANALMTRFCELRFKEGCLIQPVAQNHPDIADLGEGVLATVRILTCRDEQGGVETTNAAMRFPRQGKGVVDNFHAGGIAAAVDLRSGRLGPATDLGVSQKLGWCERHPDSQVQIAGRTLPAWPEVLAVVERAHEAFPDRVFIGWDVALLPDGWHLVEGNAAPDLDIIQRTTGMPLGNARFGRLLAFHTAVILRKT